MEVPVLRNVFAKNENAAQENRRRFDDLGLKCVNLLGGAGSGKTTLLEALLPRLAPAGGLAVMEGDLATTRDADRIARLGVPVVQLLTDGGCHLNATLVAHGLEKLPLAKVRLLIIENVGNPICPANFDLGEHLRLSVLSVTEGDDKPSKYPLLFKDMSAVVLTKCDLLPYTNFNVAQAEEDIRHVHPTGPIFRTAATRGEGIDEIASWMLEQTRPPCGSR